MATFYPRVQHTPNLTNNILHRRINPVQVQQPIQHTQPIRVSNSSLLSNSQVFQNPFFPSNQNSISQSPTKVQNIGFTPPRGLPHSQSNGNVISINQQTQRRLIPQQSLPTYYQQQFIQQHHQIQQIQKQLTPQLINKTQGQIAYQNNQLKSVIKKQVIVPHNQQQKNNQQQLNQQSHTQVKQVLIPPSQVIDQNQAKCLQEIKMSQKLLSQIKGLIPKKQIQANQVKSQLSNNTDNFYQTGDYQNYQNNFIIDQQQTINQMTVDPIQPGIRYIAPYQDKKQPNQIYEQYELQPPHQQNMSHNTSQDAHQIIYNNQPTNAYFSFAGNQTPQQQKPYAESPPQIAYPSNYYKIQQLQQIVFGGDNNYENNHNEEAQQMDEERINQQLFRSQNQIPYYQQYQSSSQNAASIQQPQPEPQNIYYQHTYQQQVKANHPNQIYHSIGLKQQTQQQTRIRRSKIYEIINAGVQQLKRQSHSKRSSHSNSRNPNFMMYLDGIDLLSYYDLHQRLLKDKDELAILYQQSFGTGHN